MEPVLDVSELYTIRMLLFMETNPQSNKYRQVLLTRGEYKDVGRCFGKIVPGKGKDQEVIVRESDEIYTLPDLQDVHIELTGSHPVV